MREKILTISVAAYNVSAYIDQCLKSIVECDCISELEVLVIDDGGTDDTLIKSQKYSDAYPESVFLVHKENGGYGSTVNYSIEHANGQYFKLLDGDDWFDTEGLSLLVNELKHENSDIVITNVLKGPSENNLHLIDYEKENRNRKKSNELSSIVGHWGITYKTELLRKTSLILPEHCLYTDKLYSTIPFSEAKSISLYSHVVYCYRTGREGQSINRSSRIKHAEEYIYVSKLLNYYATINQCNPNTYVFKRIVNGYHLAVKTILLMEINRGNRKKLIELEEQCKSDSPIVYENASSKETKTGILINLLRKSHYNVYWLLTFVPKKIIDF